MRYFLLLMLVWSTAYAQCVPDTALFGGTIYHVDIDRPGPVAYCPPDAIVPTHHLVMNIVVDSVRNSLTLGFPDTTSIRVLLMDNMCGSKYLDTTIVQGTNLVCPSLTFPTEFSLIVESTDNVPLLVVVSWTNDPSSNGAMECFPTNLESSRQEFRQTGYIDPLGRNLKDPPEGLYYDFERNSWILK